MRLHLFIFTATMLLSTSLAVAQDDYYTRGRDAYQAAEALRREGKHAEGLAAMVDMARVYPRHELADNALYGAVSIAYANLRDDKQALTLIEQAEQTVLDRTLKVNFLNTKASIYYSRLKDYKAAAPIYESLAATEGWSGAEGAFFQAVTSWRLAEAYDEVIRTAKAYQQHMPAAGVRLPQVLGLQVVAEFNSGDADAARKTLDAMDELMPGHREIGIAAYTVASQLERDGNFADASSFYERAGAIDGYENAGLSAYRAGYLLTRISPPQDALAYRKLRDYRAKYPKGIYADEVMLRIGEIHRRRKDFPKAAATMAELVKARPNSIQAPNAHRNWINDLRNSKSIPGVKDALKRYIVAYPEDDYVDDAMYQLAVILRQEQDINQARQLLQKVVADYPGGNQNGNARTLLNGM